MVERIDLLETSDLFYEFDQLTLKIQEIQNLASEFIED
jgi:hypothetical protein